MASRYDAIVIGGGVVGVATALALARGGLRTLLLAPAAPGRDGRTVAVMEGSLGFLRGLAEGLAARIESASAPLARLRIVDDTGSLFRPPPATFAAAEIGLPAFGRNIEAAHLVELLLGAARAQLGLTILERPAREVRLDEGVDARGVGVGQGTPLGCGDNLHCSEASAWTRAGGHWRDDRPQRRPRPRPRPRSRVARLPG